MGTKKRGSGIWLWFAAFTGLAIPIALYDPIAQRITGMGLGSAAITFICVMGLVAEKRWAIVLTGLRAALGVVLGLMHLSDASQLAGGFSQIRHDVRIWTLGVLAYLAALAIASLVVYIRVERFQAAAEMNAEAERAIRELDDDLLR